MGNKRGSYAKEDRAESGIKRLCAKLVLTGILALDMPIGVKVKNRKRRCYDCRDTRIAEMWFKSQDRIDPVSFLNVVEYLDLNSEKVKVFIENLMEYRAHVKYEILVGHIRGPWTGKTNLTVRSQYNPKLLNFKGLLKELEEGALCS